MLAEQEPIVAIATAPGAGAIAVIRISGKGSLNLVDQVFEGKRKLAETAGNSIVYGFIKDGFERIDEVLISVFRSPFSYTGEDTAEISCHGSVFIQKRVLELLIEKGARMAGPGEFTMRAFLHGKKDLLQAEAVADLIAAENHASHQVAMHQMRGGFSADLAQLRDDLVHFAALIELELDFSQEDVEFADRQQLQNVVSKIRVGLAKLLSSFKMGNAIKNGVPVAIAGQPNVGKSTLLNALLNEDRAIVSDIAGTTRDTIEDEVILDGIRFRFIDTAGIRSTSDSIEKLGIERSFDKIRSATLIVVLIDLTQSTMVQVKDIWHEVNETKRKDADSILVLNKSDHLSPDSISQFLEVFPKALVISAKAKVGISELVKTMVHLVGEKPAAEQTIVTNVRHYDSLYKADLALEEVLSGLNNQISADFVAIDIRKALYHLGEITGVVSTDELLGNIFGRFCIGK
ncbi:MAG: tRNA uridine-5-carboxymethylaminomethyl(34) synthesis GTPase MnmE [Bacteroidia bacterium]|nr:tRNA uridine-5-carboxymethylaminomethyl(34) synthesis GTPase MnmE [Bacteroidia bacterium]